MTGKVECPGCEKRISVTKSGRYWKHGNCDFSSTVIPEEKCQIGSGASAMSMNASSAESAPEDATGHAAPATSSPSSSATSPKKPDVSTSVPASPVIPGVTSYANTLNDMAAEQLAAYRARVEAGMTPFSQPAPTEEVEQPPLLDGEAARAFAGLPPAVPSYSQPAGRRSEAPAQEMTDLGKELTARLKELFYAWDNRRTSDNRSAQTTMGPSEMGTPCDRRLALSLMRMPPVNPGGDGWAAFVGTCIHAGLEQMFLWANAGTGRFAVETKLEFPSKIVPKGTADLIDRTLFMLDDHKCQGRWSRNKLKSQGPIPTYRVQAHVYAHGARLRGETIEHVAIISWPRDESTLDDLYVWTEPYRPDIVKEAFERVERISESVDINVKDLQRIYDENDNPDGDHPKMLEIKARVSANYDVADDCRFCPFYLPNARSITDGCNGKR